jgi:hypothetical protein
MTRIRHDMRLSKKEKNLLETIANQQGMNVTEYIKYKLFVQNPDCINNGYIYHCPSGERYNYAIAGLSMTNYLLLEALIQYLYQDKSSGVINGSLSKATEKLETLYNYTRIKVTEDE